MAELTNALRMKPRLGHPIRKVPSQLDGAMTLAILAIAGVASISLFALKGVLDQLPDVIDSASRARDAWQRFRSKADEHPPPTTLAGLSHSVDDEHDPPMAA